MSVTWRQRLAQRRLDLGLEGKEYDYLKKYMEHYCQKSDEEAKKLCDKDMLKTVDQVINSLADPEFDRFSSSVIADVSKKLGRDDIALVVENKQLSKDKGGIPFTEKRDEPPTQEQEIPA
jgi:hypothetical protein